jgi:serine/threonine protein kinase
VQWRSPEEYKDEHINEKIDVWSLGNNFYSLLTGMYVFPWMEVPETKV